MIDALEPVNVHVYAKGEHVGFIENGLKTLNERSRELCNSVPYTKYNVLITRTVVEMAAEMINNFPSKNGISKKLSPATIVEGKEKLNLGVKRIPFGACAMVYTGTSKSMKSRSVPRVSLKPSNNYCGQYFMLL